MSGLLVDWPWDCNDYIYLLNYKYQCCCYFTLFSCHAFFYSIIRFFIFKRKNFIKCLDSYIYCNYWNNNYCFGNTEKNSLLGLIFGMTSSIGFSSFFSNLEMEKRNTKIYNCCICRFFCFVVSAIIILTNDIVFFHKL